MMGPTMSERPKKNSAIPPTPHLRAMRLSRAALLRGTALGAATALTVVLPAGAQPAPNARPQGGQVVAGSAAISQSPGNTVINQSSGRAAIDWHSFDVGRNQTVTFQQPSANSATLNRVTGPDPSAIAGRISANGQVILTNPNGVTFFKGAQVNAQSLIVSAPGITNQNFMAGRMVFDQAPNPNARVENHGSITVKQAGLAALVAPSVANSGTINARLGHVVLAGAAAHTLDMYGDGLVSIDVTKQVRQVPTGPDGKPVAALVTNSGVIRADGGTVQLTARAADGVVQTLVDAGGTVRANTVGAKAGQISIAGTGGAVVIAGRISADARAGQAGTVVLNGSTATTLADGAHVSADGATGGGTIAVGTTLARARTLGAAPAATSARTTVAAGARLSANATGRGNGGRVTVLSKEATSVAGAAEAKGGAQAGNGGTVELSGEKGFRLTGRADTTAPRGRVGTVVLDPRDLTISNTQPAGTTNQPPASNTDPNIGANTGGTTTDAYVTPAQLNQLTGNVHLVTTRDLTVASAWNYTGGDVELEAGRNIAVNAALSVSGSLVLNGQGIVAVNAPTSAGGNLLIASLSGPVGSAQAGTITISAPISGQTIGFASGSGGVTLAANVTASTAWMVNTTGALTQTAGTVAAPQMYGSALSVSLPQSNAITGVGNGQNASFQTTGGGFLLTNAPGQPLTIGNAAGGGGLSVPTGQTVSLTIDSLTLAAPAGGKAISAPGGTLLLQPSGFGRNILVSDTDTSDGTALLLRPADLPKLTVGTLSLLTTTSDEGGGGNITLGQSGETIDLTGNGIGTLNLAAAAAINGSGAVSVASLGAAANYGIDLSNADNQIGTLTSFASGSGTAALSTAGDLVVTGNVGGDTVTLAAGGNLTATASSNFNVLGTLSLTAGDSTSIPSETAARVVSNGTAALTLAGSTTAADVNLSAPSGIALTGGLAASGTLYVDTSGALTQGSAAISAGELGGQAGSVTLSSSANAIASIRSFTVTNGNFTLATSSPLTIGNTEGTGLTVPSGGTISIAADQLTLGVASGGALSAPGGVVQLRPNTAGYGILLTTNGDIEPPARTMVVAIDTLARVSAFDLILGNAQTGPVALGQANEAIDLTTLGFGRLGLGSAGAVTQGQNATLTVDGLSATAGSLALANAGNQIGTFYGTVVSGNAALHTDTDLQVGAVQAGGTLALSSGGRGGMTLYADIRGQVVSLNSLNTNGTVPTAADPGIVQTSGSLTAGTLTGAAGSAQFTQTNAVAALGDFATYGGLNLNNAGTALALTGAVSSVTGPVTLGAAGITQSAAATLATPELDGSSTATTSLTARGNAIASIGSFTQAAGDFTLVTGPGGGTLTIGANGGRLTAPAGSLTLIADRVAVPSATRAGPAITAANDVTIAPYTPGATLVVGSAADRTFGSDVYGQISAPSLTLGTANSTGDIVLGAPNSLVSLNGSVTTLRLRTSGAVTQGASAGLLVNTVTGSAGSIALGNSSNSIRGVTGLTATTGALALQTGTALDATDVSATGVLTLIAGSSLALAGTNSASAATLTGPGGITQNGGILAVPGQVTLLAPNRAITQSNGTIAAGSLAAAADTVSLTGANRVSAASLSATGTLRFNDTVALTLTGLSATDATVSGASNLTLSGPIAASGTLSLQSGGAIAQPGGTLTAGTLTTASAGTTALGQANNVTNLAAASSVGGFSLVDAGALTVTGPVADATAVSLRAGTLTLAGPITTGALSLTAGQALTQTAGTLTAASLSGSAGSAALRGANAIASLGNFSAAGDVTLVDRVPLTLTGTVSAGSGRAITLAADTIIFGAGSVLSAPGGAVALGEYTAGGGMTLAGSGTVVAASATVGSAAAGPLSITGSLDVTQATVDLRSAGAITETGSGAIAAATLTGAAGSASLAGPNRIGTLGRFDTNAGFTLSDAVPLTVGGAVTVGSGQTIMLMADQVVFGTGGSFAAPSGTVWVADYTPGRGIVLDGRGIPFRANTLRVGTPTAGPISITGAFNLSGMTLELLSSGAVTETGAGAVIASVLSGQAASVNLTGDNQIGTVDRFTATGDFALVNRGTLAVAGPVTASTVELSTAGDLRLSGALTATGAVSLVASGAIEQTGGAVTAASLGGSAASVRLTGPNRIGSLADWTTVGSFAFANTVPLSIGGRVAVGAGQRLSIATPSLAFAGGTLSAPGGTVGLAGINGTGISVGGGTVALDAGTLSLGDAAGGPISITGVLDVGAATLDLRSAGAVTETNNGAVIAATLTGQAGSASLGGRNQIGTLGRFATGGNLLLNNGPDLAVAGPVSAGNLTLSTSGSLSLSGAVSTTGTASLSAAGAIGQSGGAVSAPILTAAGASISLEAAGNAIGTLGTVTTGSTFSLSSSTDLVVAAPMTASAVTLTSGGILTLASTLAASNVTLNARGGVGQIAGSVIAGRLAGTARSVSLGGTNEVDTLGFATTNGFKLVDRRALTVTGPLTDTNAGIDLTAPAITLAGPVSAPALLLSTSGAAVQTGGAINVGILTGQVGSMDIGTAAPASVGTLGPLTASGAVSLTSQSPLVVAGPIAAPAATVTGTGALVLNGGTIRASAASFAVRPGADGTARVSQLGTTTLTSPSGSPATLRLSLPPSGGTVELSNLQAPGSAVVLSLGAGNATGSLSAAQLTIQGSGGSAELSGEIGGRTGTTAAQIGLLQPGPDLRYTFNNCAIAAATCSSDAIAVVSLPTAAIASVLRPDILTLGILDLTVTRDRDDPTLLLPNISDRDY